MRTTNHIGAYIMAQLGSLTVSLAVLTTLANSAALAAGTEFCGRASGEPSALQADISKAAGIKEIYRGAEYVAYQDEATQAVFTFSQEAVGPAHPAAVCRKPVRDGEFMTLQMVVVCKGAVDACQRLESDFKLLNAKMEAAIRNEAGQNAAPK
jgi:hypothetical protein